MDWFEAQDYCYKKGNGSVLAEIYDEETWLVVKIFSNQGDRQRRGYWLGGHPIQPGGIGSKSFNCIFLFQDTENGSRPWLDVDCIKNTIYPICMKL